jgi:hypothetical protein
MKITKTVEEIWNAYQSMLEMSQGLEDHRIALKLSQNLLVLEMLGKIVEKRRNDLREKFPSIEPVAVGDRMIIYLSFPEGWDRARPNNNSRELIEAKKRIEGEFNVAISELNSTPMEIDLLGLNIDTDLPPKVSGLALRNCHWLIEGYPDVFKKGAVEEED